MPAPQVSILLPARDAAGTLPATLRSISRQTFADWECVLVDDGSRDGTLSLARAAAAADPRLRVLETPGLGIVGALTAGLAHCRGTWVARMDADDVMRRDRLERQVAALAADPALAAVGSHVRIVPRRALRDGLREYERWLNGIRTTADVRANAFVESPLVHPTLVVRRDVLHAHGWRDTGWPEDYDLLLRVLAAGHAVGVVPRRLLLWRDGPHRLTRTHPAYAQARIVACKAHFLAQGFLATHERYLLWGYGGTGRALRRALLAHGKRPSHIVEVHAGRLGNTIHGAPVVPPAAIPDLPRLPLVASVAGAEARGLIRDFLSGLRWVETRDYVCAA